MAGFLAMTLFCLSGVLAWLAVVEAYGAKTPYFWIWAFATVAAICWLTGEVLVAPENNHWD